MALTAEQIVDFQGDLGISADQSVFTDAELERLYTRADDAYNLAVYYAWRQVQAGATGWVDYKVAQTSMSRSQAYDHIKDMVAFWGSESRVAGNQVKMVGLNGVPNVWKDEPDTLVAERRRQPYRRHRGC